MAWDPTKPVQDAALLSAPVRDNFAALDTLLVQPVAGATAHSVLKVGTTDNIQGIAPTTNGQVLTLVGGAPAWAAPGAPAFPLLGPDGATATPTYSFLSNPAQGMWLAGTNLMFQTPYSVIFFQGTTTIFGFNPAGINPGQDGTQDFGDATHRLRDLWLARLTDYSNQAATPATPAAGHVIAYTKTDKRFYVRDDTGLETTAVRLAGDTMTGDLTISKGTPSLVLNKAAAGQYNLLYGQKAGLPRWLLAPGDDGAESGGNAGSDFRIARYNDAGVWLDSALTIARATGAMLLTGDFTISKLGPNLIMNKGVTAGETNALISQRNSVKRWQLNFGDGATEGGGDGGSDFVLWSYTDAGGYKETPLQIARATGLATLASLRLPEAGILNLVGVGGARSYQMWAHGAGFVMWDLTSAREQMSFNAAGSMYIYVPEVSASRYITVGGVDSGGTGYRMLRIVN